MKIISYECGLREGAQSKGISYTVEDKLRILEILDEMGVDYVEGGNPSSNIKDAEFFKKAAGLNLKNTKLVAFGSTARVGVQPKDDDALKALINAGTDTVTVFGKSWDLHVNTVLGTTCDENLKIISGTVKYLKDNGKRVFFDAEHYFDGYTENPEYAIECVKAAAQAGADYIVLCDTNGGAMGLDFYNAVRNTVAALDVPVGVHCHNDTSCADANSIIGVQAGAKMVQTTVFGLGERCGAANLFTVIPNLQVKHGFECIAGDKLTELCSYAEKLASIINVSIPSFTPYIGDRAFAHKAGMHIDGINKDSRTFEHINPGSVGNNRKILVSEIAGTSAIIKKIQQIKPDVTKNSEETKRILSKIKEMEYEGYQYEGADASLEILIRRELGIYVPKFSLENFKVVVDEPSDLYSSFAMIKVKNGELVEITADEGDGPVNALDKALRKALEVFYPQIAKIKLSDYRVRVINSTSATAAITRVLVETTDGRNTWTTVGVSKDIIKASFKALTDSIEYYLGLATE